ncbi:MAG: hypothetical protein ACKPKO_51160, partial [Candidatus Fonsibacter sp.]
MNRQEQRFTATAVNGVYYVFRVLVFGSASAPTVWGRFSAWLGRSTAAVFFPTVKLQIYVDDPAFTIRGTPARAAHDLAVSLVWGMVAGFPYAWHKSSGGSSLDWIGANLTVTKDQVRVSIPERKCKEILQETISILSGPRALPKHSLRSYAGKVSFVAGL